MGGLRSDGIGGPKGKGKAAARVEEVVGARPELRPGEAEAAPVDAGQLQEAGAKLQVVTQGVFRRGERVISQRVWDALPAEVRAAIDSAELANARAKTAAAREPQPEKVAEPEFITSLRAGRTVEMPQFKGIVVAVRNVLGIKVDFNGLKLLFDKEAGKLGVRPASDLSITDLHMVGDTLVFTLNNENRSTNGETEGLGTFKFAVIDGPRKPGSTEPAPKVLVIQPHD